MEKDVRVLLEERLEVNLEKLEEYNLDAKERAALIKEITELGKTLNEMIRTEADQFNKEQDLEFKKKQQLIDKVRAIGGVSVGAATVIMYALGLFGEAKGAISPRMTNMLPKPPVKV